MDRQKTIVVVDDDESIRKTFNLVFNGNYRVCLAGDSREALKRFDPASIDLIIADVRLPRVSGTEMISLFRRAGYGGPVIMISGDPDSIDPSSLDSLRVARFFVKPLDLETLAQSVRSLLN